MCRSRISKPIHAITFKSSTQWILYTIEPASPTPSCLYHLTLVLKGKYPLLPTQPYIFSCERFTNKTSPSAITFRCFNATYVFEETCVWISYNHIHETHSSEGKKATREKGIATSGLKLTTYALSRSFSHVSHRDRSRSFVPHCSYVPVTGVPLSSDT